MNKLIWKTIHVVDKSKREMKEQNSQILSNEKELNRLKQDYTKSKDTLSNLETEMANEISIAITPIKIELANASYNLMNEKAQRVHDKIHLASLWPPDWTLPSILSDYQKYKKKLREKAIQIEKDLSRKKRTKQKSSSFLEQFSSFPQITSISRTSPIEKIHDQTLGIQSKTTEKKSSWEEVVERKSKFYRNCETGEKCLFIPHESSINDDIWEFTKCNVVQASRIVVLYLNGIVNRSKSIDEDTLPYDIHTVEELAIGDNGWDFNTFFTKSQNDKSISKSIDVSESIPLQKLRSLIKDATKREKELSEQIINTRISITKLSLKILQSRSEQKIEKNISDYGINAHFCFINGTDVKNRKSVNFLSPGQSNKYEDQDHELSLSSLQEKTSSVKYNSHTSDSSIDVVQSLVRSAVYAGFYNKLIHDSLPITELNQYEKWLVSKFFTTTGKTNSFSMDEQNFETNLSLMSSSLKMNINKNHDINIESKHGNNGDKKDLSPFEHIKEFSHLSDTIMLSQDDSEDQYFYDIELKDSKGLFTNKPAFQKSVRSISVDDKETFCSDSMEHDKAELNSCWHADISIENETFVHESIINQLFVEIEKNQNVVNNDHINVKTNLKSWIEAAKKEIKRIKNNLSLMQNKMASLNFKYNGLNIMPTKPVPPLVSKNVIAT